MSKNGRLYGKSSQYFLKTPAAESMIRTIKTKNKQQKIPQAVFNLKFSRRTIPTM